MLLKNDFARVKNNDALKAFGKGTQIYPVISENVAKNTDYAIDKDMVVFALKNMNFLTDAAKKEAELKRAEDELDNISADMHKLDGRKQMIWEDYTFAVKYESALESVPEADIKEAEQELSDITEKLNKCHSEHEEYKNKKAADTEKIEKFGHELEELKKQADGLKKIADVYADISCDYDKLTSYNDRLVKG